MSYENLDQLNDLFERLTTDQKLDYFETLLGEHLGNLWKNWDDEMVADEIRKFKEVYGVEK